MKKIYEFFFCFFFLGLSGQREIERVADALTLEKVEILEMRQRTQKEEQFSIFVVGLTIPKLSSCFTLSELRVKFCSDYVI